MGKEVIDSKSGEMGIQSHSVGNSPIPYLFGGLGAMLCLIMVALLILACSFWNRFDSTERDDDVEANRKDIGEESIKAVYLEEFVVIMAGDTKPTFLATPIFTTSSTAATVIDTTKSNDDHLVNKQDEDERGETSEPPDAID